jgi:hypothetical protein
MKGCDLSASVVELRVLFGSGRSLEMVRAEVPALSRRVPQDGNELNGTEDLKRQNKPIQNLLLSASQRGEIALRQTKRWSITRRR